MTTITIVIKDDPDGAIHMEGNVDDPAAFQKRPTPAVIFSGYLAANAEQLAQSAWEWFRDSAKADDK